MLKELLFFDKRVFNAFRVQKEDDGFEIISITDCLQSFDNISKIEPYQIVDITTLAIINDFQYDAERMFSLFDEETIFISDVKHKELFIHNLRYCFAAFNDIDISPVGKPDFDHVAVSSSRGKFSKLHELLFFDQKDLKRFQNQKEVDGFKIISITDCLQDFENISKIESYHIIDISVLASINEFQYNAERVFSLFNDDIKFIADIKHKELFSYNLRYCFNSFKDIGPLGSESESSTTSSNLAPKHKKIIDLDANQVNLFLSTFSQHLYGHEKFKDDFAELINNFRIFNKLGEHKILSLFLMGESGVGKTEVARVIHKCLGGTRKLAKVNFGNYSSDNALNSLIGSPRGYIGSEEGEIFIRVKESDVGLILIDEFEKSNSTLFNYFLDVLENGKMVSSMTEEIDLNGFIIIFTSNISKEDFTQRISPELRSRFDYKGMFTLLYNEDKEKFVEFRVNKIIEEFHNSFKIPLPADSVFKLVQSIQVHKYCNMRDLNKAIKKTFVDYISSTIDTSVNNFILNK